MVAPVSAPLPAPSARSAPPAISHCGVGAGVPLAATVKLALPPAAMLTAAGWVVMTGATVIALTVSTAALLVTLPALLPTLTLKAAPESASVADASV